MLKATALEKSYGNLKVLKGVDIAIEKGEMVAITGPSGAGKSTLLQILGTLDLPDKGSFELDDVKITALNAKKLAAFRNQNIGFVFQFHNLLPEFTALENICIPAYIAGLDEKIAKKNAEKLLKLLGISARANHKPSELSGGEQQRVAVARALMNNPKIIFADEPSGNLDSKNAEELHQLFVKLKTERQQTFVIVTHNEQLAGMADRWLTMKDGQLAKN